MFEGGIRVPAAISWPAKLKAGEIRNQWVSRKGDWKLLGNPAIWDKKLSPTEKLVWFNLKDEPGETNNLVERCPEKVRELQIQYKEWLKKNQ